APPGRGRRRDDLSEHGRRARRRGRGLGRGQPRGARPRPARGLPRLVARTRLGQADPGLRRRRAHRCLPRGRPSSPHAAHDRRSRHSAERARGHPRARSRLRRPGVHRGRLGRLRAGPAGRRARRRVHDHHPDRALQCAPGRTHRGRRGRGSRRLQAGALDVSLIYIEFISRRPGVALEAFHAVAGGGQEGWAGDYAADVAVLNLGRTWRMGPEPEYLTAWYSPSAGLERLDEWERILSRATPSASRSPSGWPRASIAPAPTSRCWSRSWAAPAATTPSSSTSLRGPRARTSARSTRSARSGTPSSRSTSSATASASSDLTPAGSRSGVPPRTRRWTRSRAISTASRARSGSSPRRSTTTSAPRRCERMTAPLAADGRGVIVAIDHPLYSWPCRGLEDREALLRAVVAAGADAVIVSYGTLRDCRDALGDAAPILKLDLTTLTLEGYGTTEYVEAWTVDDAVRLGAGAVLTFVQVGTPFEL